MVRRTWAPQCPMDRDLSAEVIEGGPWQARVLLNMALLLLLFRCFQIPRNFLHRLRYVRHNICHFYHYMNLGLPVFVRKHLTRRVISQSPQMVLKGFSFVPRFPNGPWNFPTWPCRVGEYARYAHTAVGNGHKGIRTESTCRGRSKLLPVPEN